MLDAKPTIFISHSTVFKEQVAVPFRDHIKSLGMNAILVGDMPVPADADSDPETKVDYFLQGADMFVALLTPDDHLQDGEIRSRPNIADEIGRAKSLPLLRRRIQVFRAPGVKVHSNINPTYEPLDISDPAASFPTFERQAIEWGVMRRPGSESVSEPAVGPIGPAEAERSEGHEGDGATIQAASALAQLRSTLLGLKEDPDLSRALAIRRAHIAASTALTSLTSTTVYGVHELNGLYRARAELQLSPEEIRHLFRSVVLHLDSDTAPGWYWLRSSTATEVHVMLIELAAEDPDTELRAIALTLLARAPRKLARSQVNSLVSAGLDSEDGQIRSATLRLLGAKGDLRLLGKIKAKLGRDSAEAQLEIRARETPIAALKALVADPFSYSENAERTLLANPKKLPTSTLREGLDTTSYTRTRLLCLRGLERSSRLRREDLVHLLSDKNAKLRDRALEIAIRRGWKVDEALAEEAIKTSDLDFHASGEMQLAYLRTRSREQLEERLKWIGGDGWHVYAALGLSGGPQVAQKARTDLDSEFAALRKEHRTVVREAIETAIIKTRPALAQHVEKPQLEELVEQKLSQHFESYKNLDPFTLKRFQAAALRVLCELGEPSDAKYGRMLLFANEHDIVLQAVRLLARFGEPDEAPRIVDAAGQLYFEARREAAEAAVTLAEDKVAIAKVLIENDDDSLRQLGIEVMEGAESEQSIETLLPLLDDSSDSIRAAAIDQLSKQMKPKGKQMMIDAYSRGGYYFYNVITRLDRSLYAPGWFRTAAARKS